MALLEILKYPNPSLRKKTKAVKKVDARIIKLVNDMVQTMYGAPGVGLAAPQVGELLKIVVVDVGEGLIVIINPKITKRSGSQFFVEGCLSLPNLEAPVERPAQVSVRGLDIKGKNISFRAEGLLATVLQHEIDHLDGKLFIDRVSDPTLIRHVTKEEARTRDKVCIKGKTEECMM